MKPATAAGTSYKVLFAVRNFWYLKYYDSVIRLLAERGHRVHVVADSGDSELYADWSNAMRRLAAEQPGITFAFAPGRRDSWWADLGYWIHRAHDHVRFFDAAFDRAPILRRRAERRGWGIFSWMMERLGVLRPRVGRVIEWTLATVERATVRVEHLEDLFRAEAPDVVVVTPLVSLGAAQSDVVVASQRLGIPTAVAVGSWDHLSSKARIRTRPDRLFVWNDTQRTEAVRYHRLPRERVVITGAQCFDQWFGRTPSRSRAEFCSALGLPPDRPLLFYVGSSLFWDSPNEAAFIVRWARALRASRHEVLREASILVRPHPKRGYEWDEVDSSEVERMVVWPPRGQPPLDAESKAGYFDSLYHSAAVIGLNTSAQIEAGLIGRPVFTVLLPEFWDNQEGTLHFNYLLNLDGGLLHASRSLDEHFDQLAAGLAEPERAAEKNRAFVKAFVRPHGFDVPATGVFVDALLDLAAGGRLPAARPPRWGVLMRILLFPVAVLTRGTAPQKWVPGREMEVPAWAWRMRAVTRHLAPYLPVLGSARSWREAEYRRKGELRSKERMARERADAEQRRQKHEQRARKAAEQRQRREQIVADRERRRREALERRAQVLAEREQAKREKALRRQREDVRKSAARSWRRGVGALRGRAAGVYRRLSGAPLPQAPEEKG